jgi:lysophospholipase L1-like esterase
MKSAFKIIIVNGIILSSLLLIVELFFGAWIFSTNNLNNLGILKDTELVYKHDLYKSPDGLIHYTRDKFGLRGASTFNQPSKIDILTVGGSTTDQRYTTDSLTWQECLEKKLKLHNKPYLVANAGVDGQSTYGHIKNFELWFPEVADLKPKYILFYVGINDFLRISDNNNYDNLSINDYTWAQRMMILVRNNSAIYNLVRKLKGALDAKAVKVSHDKIDFDTVKYTKHPTTHPNSELVNVYEQQVVPNFKKRIQTLINYSVQLKAKPIFITQPSIKYKFINDTLHGVSETSLLIDKYPCNGVDYYQLLTLLNNGLKEVCKDNYPVIELTSLTSWDSTHFYDFYHYTPAGTKKVGDEIFKELVGILP